MFYLQILNTDLLHGPFSSPVFFLLCSHYGGKTAFYLHCSSPYAIFKHYIMAIKVLYAGFSFEIKFSVKSSPDTSWKEWYILWFQALGTRWNRWFGVGWYSGRIMKRGQTLLKQKCSRSIEIASKLHLGYIFIKYDMKNYFIKGSCGNLEIWKYSFLIPIYCAKALLKILPNPRKRTWTSRLI